MSRFERSPRALTSPHATRVWLAAGLVWALFWGQPAGAQHPTPAKSIEALAIDEPITVDGRLDEEVWSRAAVASGFTQREKPTEPASENTEFMVVYTSTVLYIGLRFFDPRPGEIVAKEMEYDGRLFRDDSVIVMLDTFHDHRNGYFMETNPNGALLDALSTDEGRTLNSDWDGVWSAASRITDDGWTSEMAIPFATLRFDPKLDTWGFNVRRLVARSSEQSYWAQVGRDANLLRMSRAGHLTGLEDLTPTLNLRLKPFAVGDATEAGGGDSRQENLEAGLDFKWGLTRGLALDLTYNTDFAESEADDQQVNLTRFSLFFDEKREFFLENAGIFEVVPPSQVVGTPALKLFHSRRLGISPSGLPVPIEWGARLTGRAGEWSLGLLEVSTEDLNPEESSTATGIAADRWGIVRVKRNVGKRSALGMIFTHRDPQSADQGGSGGGTNMVYGLDADLNPSPKLNVNTFYAVSREGGSRDSGGGADGVSDWAGGASAVWSGQDWVWALEAMEIGDDFNPEAGFLLRSGIRRYAPTLIYRPKPEIQGVRNFVFDVQGEVITDLDDTLETLSSRITLFGFVLDSEDQAQVFTGIHRERLLAPFQIQPGVIIPPGEYDFVDYGVSYSTSPTRQHFYASGTVSHGEFFDGDRFSNVLTVGLRPSRFFRTETRWSHDEVDLPGGSFSTNVWRQRLSLSFSPNLSTNAFLQFNDAADLVSLNLRLNWIYRPGSDLFVVFNQNWNAPSLGSLSRRESQVIVKLTYLLEL